MANDPVADLAAKQRQLVNLRQSKTSGVLRAESPDGGSVTYRTYAEMQMAESDLLKEIAALQETVGIAPRRRPARRLVLTSRSGF